MQLEKFLVQNFSSYKELSFNFNDVGLCLIKGSTGSGKTTFLDIPLWIMFGITSKNGAVDDVCSWFSTDEATRGSLHVRIRNDSIHITRIRGYNVKNDLFFTLNDDPKPVRGKDLIETQKLLNEALGIDPASFLSASYFNEFSEATTFFHVSAKDRRKLFEKLTNLKFPKLLAEKLSEQKKHLKKSVLEETIKYERLKAKIEQAQDSLQKVKSLESKWQKDQDLVIVGLKNKIKSYNVQKQVKIEELTSKSFRYDSEKEKQLVEVIDRMEELDEKIKPYDYFEMLLIEAEQNARAEDSFCLSCNQLLPEVLDTITEITEQKIYNSKLLDRRALCVQEIERVQKSINPYSESLKTLQQNKNQFVEQLKEEVLKTNPFKEHNNTSKVEFIELSLQSSVTEKHLGDLKKKLNNNEVLLELTSVLRNKMLAASISYVEQKINSLISEYFDGEFSVFFKTTDKDSLSIEILKNSYSCSYSQLSKGQRQILKLSFAIAIMDLISNECSMPLTTIFFDEPADGLDEDLKLKCFNLLNSLIKNKKSIFVVEHSSFLQNMFEKQYEVTLDGNESILNEKS